MAVRPIVYGARYYFSGKRVSHWHLYRIGADGRGRRQLTFGKADDTQPVWSPNGKWIAFSRVWQNDAHPNTVCMVPAGGGEVRTVFSVGRAWLFSAQWLSNTHLLVHCDRSQGQHDTTVVSLKTDKPERIIRHTWQNALSPGKTHLVTWSDGTGRNMPTIVTRLKDGHKTTFPDEVGGSFAWLGNQRFVALGYAEKTDTWHLHLCSAEGKILKRIPLQFDSTAQLWLAQAQGRMNLDKDLINSAAFVDAEPGRGNTVLVGWQLGGSHDGRWAATYRADLDTGRLTPWAITDHIVPSPDTRHFLTTRPRDLVEIPGSSGSEWGAPLLLGETANPRNQRYLVSGRVYVEGFDWRA